MFRTCKSYADQSACVADLGNACADLKRALAYSDADARTVALDNIIAIARSGQMTLNLLDSWAKGDNTIRQIIPQLLGLQTLTQEGVDFAGNVLSKTGKLSLVMLSHFQIENALSNIHRELGLTAPRKGFFQYARAILEHLGLPYAHLDVLSVSARIRNSLHANGIHHQHHHNEKPRVILRGVTYTFIDGQKVSCADWEHIANALEASVDVFEAICRHPAVIIIPDPMMDQYAWEMVTAP